MPRMSITGRAGLVAVMASIVATAHAHDLRAASTSTLAETSAGPVLQLARAQDPADERGRQTTRPAVRSPLPRELPSLYPHADPARPAAGHAGLDAQGLTEKLALWVMLQDDDTAPPFETIVAFVEGNPTWPGQSRLRARAEKAIADETPDPLVIKWFTGRSPQTAKGAMALAEALFRNDGAERAIKMLRRAWVSIDMEATDEAAFIDRFGKYIEDEQHVARLDRLLWERRVGAARRQMDRVGEGRRALADARLRLMRLRGGVDAAVDRVPDWLADDPGLAFERLRWRRRKDLNDGAVELLLEIPPDARYARYWWREREIVARRLLAEGDARTAYRIVSAHGMPRGSERADAEFLSGWIALRFLDDPQTAFRHFVDLYDSVRYSISLARASFWAGRSAEAAGDKANARLWYQTAAAHVTTFYGQLAAQRLEDSPSATLPREPEIGAQARAAFDRDELVRSVRLLIALRDGNAEIAERAADRTASGVDPASVLAGLDEDDALVPFLRHIAWRSKTPQEWVLAAELAREADRNEVAVYIARRAARDGIILGDLGYPTLSMPEEIPPEPALVHALVRQESGFDPGARSRAGARGLMQLMPGTARRVARSLKLTDHSTERLTSDPNHNVLLGSAYLDSMLERFDGSMVMALAAYNAGPHRVTRWLKENGDPRGSLDDTIDWIESIPFSETRNYVQRVLETLPIYRWKLEGGRVAALRPEDLAGPAPSEVPAPQAR